jgi:hypothetical protein
MTVVLCKQSEGCLKSSQKSLKSSTARKLADLGREVAVIEEGPKEMYIRRRYVSTIYRMVNQNEKEI